MARQDRMHLSIKCPDCFVTLLCLMHVIHGETSHEPCPNGWYHDKEGSSCYLKSAQGAVWQHARRHCQTLGGDLTTIEDMNSEIVISYLISKEDAEYWIGMTFNSKTQTYYELDEIEDPDYDNYWSTDPDLYYAYDYKDYPSVPDLICVYIFPDLTRRSTPCSADFNFICHKPQFANFTQSYADFGATCDPGWHLYKDGQTCFFLSDERIDWSTARLRCQEYGGDLPVFLDPGSLIFFNGLVSQHRNPYWIGLHDQGFEGIFQWLDDPTEAPFTYWRKDEPNNINNEDCAYVHPAEIFQWNDALCSETLVLACQKPANNSTDQAGRNYTLGTTESVPIFITASTTPLPNRCPSGWHHFATKDACYNLSDTRETWYNARAFCQVAQGDLAVIENSKTHNFISGIMATQPGPYWIGLHDNHNEGDFYWLDETDEAGYTNWSPGEPNNVDDEDCAYVTPKSFKWNDAKCMAELLYVCENPGADDVTDSTEITITGKCPRNFDYYQEEDICYGFYDRRVSWYAARTFCRHYGGDLATIKSAKVQAHISSLMEGKRGTYWVGLHDVGFEGIFHWLDDIQKASYFQWAPNQPDNQANNEDCVAIKSTSHSSTWSDEPCHNNHLFLCQTRAYVDGVIPSMQATIPTPKPSEHCLQGWTFHQKAQTCYALSTIGGTWHKARSYCSALGGDLAVIKNPNAHIIINYLIAQQRVNTWFGLHDQGNEGDFVWLDEKKRTDYTFWKPNEPNNVGNEDCAFITPNMGWQDGNCAAEMLFACERTAVQIHTASTPLPGSCSDGWYYDPEEQICFGVFNDSLTWTGARTECQKYEGGDLAVFKDPQRLIFVNDILRLAPSEYWIGLHKETSGGYKWLGDDTEIYPYWWNMGFGIYEEGKQCVHTGDKWPFRWKDDPCTFRYRYVCQASASVKTTTLTATDSITADSSSSTSQGRNTTAPFGEGLPGHLYQSGSDAISSGAVVGIVIAILIVISVVGVAAYFFIKRRQGSDSSSLKPLKSPAESFDNVIYNNSSA